MEFLENSPFIAYERLEKSFFHSREMLPRNRAEKVFF
jgi:hypothetical protein